MYLTYKEAIEIYKTDYRLKKALQREEIFYKEKGVYSTTKYTDDLAILFKKNPNAILTLHSAFYFHGLSDYVPTKHHIATKKKAYPIKDSNVQQYYLMDNHLNIGVTTVNIKDVQVFVYDLERTFIELVRYSTKINYDEYYHVFKNFKERINDIDIFKIEKYSESFKSVKKISRALDNLLL